MLNSQKTIKASRRYPILNTYVNALSLDETVAEVEKIIAAGAPTQHVVVNASKVNLMEADPKLAEIVNACPLINADGASILFQRLVELSAEKGYKVYLFGAKEEVVSRVRAIFEERYPGIQIVGYRNGYFTEADEPQIVADMAASGADMMFVAFSSPKKEYWVHKYLNQIGIPFVMGVGGSFDVVAGVTDRAPKWMQDHGLEWFYRFIQEPGRLWKRYIVGNAKFVALTYRYKFSGKGE